MRLTKAVSLLLLAVPAARAARAPRGWTSVVSSVRGGYEQMDKDREFADPTALLKDAVETCSAAAEAALGELCDEVQSVLYPMVHFGEELRATTRKMIANFDAAVEDVAQIVEKDMARDALLRRCADAAAEPLLSHVSALQAQYRSRFEDRFAAVLGGTEDFEERSEALKTDALGGMRAAAVEALPDMIGDVLLGEEWHEEGRTLKEAVMGLLDELEDDLEELITERREDARAMRELAAEIEENEREAKRMKRIKYIVLQAVAVGLNWLQFHQNRRAAQRENERREQEWPRLPLF